MNEEIKTRIEKINFDDIGSQSFAVQVEAYNFKYNELREAISRIRKEGKDPYMAEIHLANFKAKLHIAEVTREQKDLDVVKNMIIASMKELKDAEGEKIINIKSEIEEGVKKLIEEEGKKEKA